MDFLPVIIPDFSLEVNTWQSRLMVSDEAVDDSTVLLNL